MLRSEHGKVSSEILGSLVGSRGFFRFLVFLGEVGDVRVLRHLLLDGGIADVHPILAQHVLQRQDLAGRKVEVVVDDLLAGRDVALRGAQHEGDAVLGLAEDLIVHVDLDVLLLELFLRAAGGQERLAVLRDALDRGY